MLVLLEELETSRAAACTMQEVIQKYEREVHMLQRALHVHAEDFKGDGDEPVHSSLIIALAEVLFPRDITKNTLDSSVFAGMTVKT